jgi:hypothetical protein
MRFADGSVPQLLDIIQVPLIRSCPLGYQTENYLIDNTRAWQREGRLPISFLPSLCDPANRLWLNLAGLTDRIPEQQARDELRSSLLLICPQKLVINVGWEFTRQKVRAEFTLGGERYRLVVTDPDVEGQFRARGNSAYPIQATNVYLTISLGEPHEHFAYKLVAAVFNLPAEH